MSDSDDQLPPRNRPFQYRLRTVFLVIFAVALLLGFWTLRQRQPFADIESLRLKSQCPISLHIIYVDNPTTSATGLHVGTATYIFKNNMPLKATIAFPPIGCNPDFSVPFAAQTAVYVPSFCRQPRLVEFPPHGEMRFTAPYGFTGDSAPRILFMFGNPSNSQDASLLVTPVYSTSELR
jgi:hypothetical protein